MRHVKVTYREAAGLPEVDVTNTDWNTTLLSNHMRDVLKFEFAAPTNFVSIEFYAEIGEYPVCADIEVYDAGGTKIKSFFGPMWTDRGIYVSTFTIRRDSPDISRLECRAGGGESAFLSYAKLTYN